MQESNIRKHMDEEMERIRADLLKLGGLAGSFIQNAVWALAKQDLDLARQVVTGDDEVDDLERQVFRELLVLMIEHPRSIEQATTLINVARNLERAGDHATNLGEHILFLIEGQHVKASSFRRPLGA